MWIRDYGHPYHPKFYKHVTEVTRNFVIIICLKTSNTYDTKQVYENTYKRTKTYK